MKKIFETLFKKDWMLGSSGGTSSATLPKVGDQISAVGWFFNFANPCTYHHSYFTMDLLNCYELNTDVMHTELHEVAFITSKMLIMMITLIIMIKCKEMELPGIWLLGGLDFILGRILWRLSRGIKEKLGSDHPPLHHKVRLSTCQQVTSLSCQLISCQPAHLGACEFVN